MECRVDKEVGTVDKDERWVRRKPLDDRVNGRVAAHLGGIDHVARVRLKRKFI
jgi:hypothetical protein